MLSESQIEDRETSIVHVLTDESSGAIVKLFCHISEFVEPNQGPGGRFPGSEAIPAMLMIADRVTLWSPSGVQFDEAHGAGTSPLSSSDLIRLMDLGLLQVIGREDHLMDPSSRQQPGKVEWWGSKWTHFDNEIRDRVLHSGGHDPDGPVMIAPAEGGWKWAREQREASLPPVARAQTLIRQGQVPGGLADRLGALPDAEQVALALRNARNHVDALETSGADLAVEPSLAAGGMAWIADGTPPGATEEPAAISAGELADTIRFVQEVSILNSAQAIERALEAQEIHKLRSRLRSLSRNPSELIAIDAMLAHELSNASLPRRMWTATRDNPSEVAASALLSVLVGMLTAPVGAVGLAGGLLGGLFSPTWRVLNDEHWSQGAEEWQDIDWLFLLITGRSRTPRTAIGPVRTALTDYLNRAEPR